MRMLSRDRRKRGPAHGGVFCAVGIPAMHFWSGFDPFAALPMWCKSPLRFDSPAATGGDRHLVVESALIGPERTLTLAAPMFEPLSHVIVVIIGVGVIAGRHGAGELAAGGRQGGHPQPAEDHQNHQPPAPRVRPRRARWRGSAGREQIEPTLRTEMRASFILQAASRAGLNHGHEGYPRTLTLL
jgi:hypothetical protein